MRTIVINGTSFIGKTTLLEFLQESIIPGRCAFLDGDDTIRVSPFELSLEWLNLVQDNILACAINFEKFGINTFFCAFPFPNSDRMERLNQKFKVNGYNLEWINLIVDDRELERRFRLRKGENPNKLQLGFDMNDSIKKFKEQFLIDTTKLTVKETAEIVVDHINSIKS